MSIFSFHMPERITLEASEEDSSTFVFKPLERGFGTTIGNALRRVLLSSLEGYAVSSIKIPGLMHEFTALKGVVEDLPQLILNLKMLRFKQTKDIPDEVLRIKVHKQTALTGKDIQQASRGFEVLNPDLVLCHLEPEATLELELTVIKGRGYVSAEEHPLDKETAYGTISVDSIFTPIRNVEYHVENTRVERRTDYERLSIRVDTDGSIDPRQALQEAASILIKHIILFSDKHMGEGLEQDQEAEIVDEKVLRMRKTLKTPIKDLDLSVRAFNCLKSANVATLGDIVRLEVSDMMKFKNFGKKSLAELEQLVEDKGIAFGMDISAYKLDD